MAGSQEKPRQVFEEAARCIGRPLLLLPEPRLRFTVSPCLDIFQVRTSAEYLVYKLADY